MPNENLEKLVQYARDKKPVAFKELLHTEIGSRMSTKISDIKTNLSKTMFQTGKEEVELDEGKLSKSDGERIDNIVANLKKNKKTKEFADKFKKDVMKSMDIEKSLENVLPDYKRGDKRYSAVSKYFNSTEEVELDEGGAYGNDRFLVKGNKAKLDNPKRGEKDGPNHVWAKNEKEALKKCKEEVELDEGKKLTSGGKKKAKKGSAVRVYTGDDVQLKDGVGTVIACQHKRDGPQRCLLKMRKSGKEINTTVHPRQVIYSNVDNTVYSESVELDEALKPKDKNVIDAFYDKKKLEGKLLFTDGDKLEKLGMGRDTVAVWKGHKIVITSSSAVKSDDVILRYMKKSIPKLNFDPKSYKKYFGEESVRGNDMEDKFKLQKETVEFLKPTSKNLGESIPDFKSTDFKGSKSVTITRISGGSWGIMIQLTDKKRVPSNIQLPASEAVVLGRALQNKDLMKEE